MPMAASTKPSAMAIGIVTTGISGRGDAARAVALQGDGKILVAGGSNQQLNSNFAVARYDTDGTLDATFR